MSTPWPSSPPRTPPSTGRRRPAATGSSSACKEPGEHPRRPLRVLAVVKGVEVIGVAAVAGRELGVRPVAAVEIAQVEAMGDVTARQIPGRPMFPEKEVQDRFVHDR